MGVQTSIGAPAVAFEGMLADLSRSRDIISRKLADSAGLAAGRALIQVVGADDQCSNTSIASGDAPNIIGFSKLETWMMPQDQTNTLPQWAQYDVIPIVRKGRIWLRTIDAITAQDIPYISYASTTWGQVQKASTSGFQLSFGQLRCVVGAGAGALAEFEVDIP